MTSTQNLDKEQYVLKCWDSARSYCEDVTEGRIVANQNIKLAVRRHEEDLMRDDLEWRPEAVEKVFKFFSYLYIDNGVQFTLQPFQAFIIIALFGLYYRDTDVRKYLYAFLFIARKNGKTTFAAALQLYFMLGDGVTFPQSVLVAGSQNQANDTAFKELRQIIMCSPALNTRLEVMQSNKIVFKDRRRYGWTKTVPAITDRLEGLNPTSCILDEIHTYKDAQKFNVIKNALGTKSNPMLFLISTAGYGKDSFCAQLVETGRNVLRGVSTDDRFFYLLYELEEGDDIENERLWVKANPGLGSILDNKLFKDQFNTNKSIPSLFNDFVTKRFNIFLEENSPWIPSEYVSGALRVFDDAEVKGYPCYVGVDLSATRDLTSIVCFWVGPERFYVKPIFFFVRSENNVMRKGSIDVGAWARDGHVIECKTKTIDYELVVSMLKRINDKYDVKGVFYDPWHFDRVLNEMKESGIWCVPIAPTVKNFDGAVRFTEGLLYEKKMDIYNNACMVWNFRNVALWSDMNGNVKPNKNQSNDAIDGVVALLNAVSGYLKTESNAASRYLNI